MHYLHRQVNAIHKATARKKEKILQRHAKCFPNTSSAEGHMAQGD